VDEMICELPEDNVCQDEYKSELLQYWNVQAFPELHGDQHHLRVNELQKNV
jgi:hypothetical protein